MANCKPRTLWSCKPRYHIPYSSKRSRCPEQWRVLSVVRNLLHQARQLRQFLHPSLSVGLSTNAPLVRWSHALANALRHFIDAFPRFVMERGWEEVRTMLHTQMETAFVRCPFFGQVCHFEEVCDSEFESGEFRVRKVDRTPREVQLMQRQ